MEDDYIQDDLKSIAFSSSKIDVVNKDKSTTTVYFSKLPHHNFHSPDLKESFLEVVDRTDAKTKSKELFEESDRICDSLKQDYIF